MFINRCSHIHESDIWWIIDHFEAILPHFTRFIHCWKPTVSLAWAYWPYSLIIFIFYKLFSINQWGSRTLRTWRYKNKNDLPDMQNIFCIKMHAYSLKRLIKFFSREFESVNRNKTWMIHDNEWIQWVDSRSVGVCYGVPTSLEM